ncbi:efflux RND transporter periplasmic adaptor subunit [Aquimarina sp. 2201CG5-10]|uniref:efflux RND transporter periplasmic adaptor subunit n=1 Tax=Aquimarina callyspongiae TaxID=3098150 RepID=UPI002AB3E82A|nr:efflux RND transporter periplasmic adaptor subunit [Aquimarina sp. 2201CG5-10]MDY8137958.1 efflux RND transporter periplasmic adaptor subunit [Aquimarina sp. 2201CG5-10]
MKYIVNIFAIILFATTLLSCGGEEKKEEKLVRPVKYEEVGYLGGEKIRTFSGTAKTDKIINLSFRNNGIITEFDIKLGQNVKKGQLLARLDNVQSRLNYESAVSSKNSAESQMNTAKLSLNRVRSLFEKGTASLSDFEAAKNSYKTAQESYESSKRSVAIQEEQIRYGYLYAPEDGVIAAINAEIDENVTSGQNIATLNAGTDMEITLGIPESVINGVKEGMEVEVNFTSIQNKKFKAKVTEVSPAVDSNTATYPVRVTVINPSSEIKSGMATNVTFDFGNQDINTKILVVPTNAVGEDSSGRFVFLIEGDTDIAKVKKQQVTVGNLTGEGFEVISGLSIGQKIATAGLQTLLDGQEVKLQ